MLYTFTFTALVSYWSRRGTPEVKESWTRCGRVSLLLKCLMNDKNEDNSRHFNILIICCDIKLMIETNMFRYNKCGHLVALYLQLHETIRSRLSQNITRQLLAIQIHYICQVGIFYTGRMKVWYLRDIVYIPTQNFYSFFLQLLIGNKILVINLIVLIILF